MSVGSVGHVCVCYSRSCLWLRVMSLGSVGHVCRDVGHVYGKCRSCMCGVLGVSVQDM